MPFGGLFTSTYRLASKKLYNLVLKGVDKGLLVALATSAPKHLRFVLRQYMYTVTLNGQCIDVLMPCFTHFVNIYHVASLILAVKAKDWLSLIPTAFKNVSTPLAQ